MDSSALHMCAVKIACPDRGEEGSGFLFYPNRSSGYYYILTAKHCLTGKQFDKVVSPSDVWLTFQANPNISSQTPTYQPSPETDTVLLSSNAEDLAIIIIQKERLDLFLSKVDIPILTAVHSETLELNEPCLFRGFTRSNQTVNGKAENLRGKIIDPQMENHFFQIEVDNYNHHEASAKELFQGFSGSGVLVNRNESLCLVGILQTFTEDFKRFTAIGLFPVNELLLEEGKARGVAFSLVFQEGVSDLDWTRGVEEIIRIFNRPYLRVSYLNQALNRLYWLKENLKTNPSKYYELNLHYKKTSELEDLINSIHRLRNSLSTMNFIEKENHKRLIQQQLISLARL